MVCDQSWGRLLLQGHFEITLLFWFCDYRGPANIPIETGPTEDRMKFTNTIQMYLDLKYRTSQIFEVLYMSMRKNIGILEFIGMIISSLSSNNKSSPEE